MQMHQNRKYFQFNNAHDCSTKLTLNCLSRLWSLIITSLDPDETPFQAVQHAIKQMYEVLKMKQTRVCASTQYQSRQSVNPYPAK